MRLFIDTDILLDVLLNRQPHVEDSGQVLDWAEANPGMAAVSWHGLANLHYLSKGGAEDFIDELMGFAEIPRTGSEHMRQALDLKFKDLEDAMQVAAATLFTAQVIVTRNTRDYKTSPIKAITAREALAMLC
jgi:predicted nucleic acid-binding protein